MASRREPSCSGSTGRPDPTSRIGRLSLGWLGTSLLATVLTVLLGLTSLVSYKVMKDVLWVSNLRNMDYQVLSAAGMVPGKMVSEVSQDEFRLLIHEGVQAPPDWCNQAERFSGGVYAVQILDAKGQLLSLYPPGRRPFTPAPERLEQLRQRFVDGRGPVRITYEAEGGRQILIVPLSQAGQLVGFVTLSTNWFPSENFLSVFAQAAGLITAGIVLVVVLIYLAVVRQLSTPLQRVLECARLVTGGDLSARTGLSDQTNEIYQVGATFDRMLDRLEWLFQTQKNFVADVSHELRTPLTALTGQLHVIRALSDHPQDRRGERALKRCEKETERMVKLVEDLLGLMRAEELPPARDFFSAAELMADCIQEISAPFGESRVTQRPGDALIWGQREALRRALLNVLENACNYSPPGKPVEVWVEETSELQILHVLDQGQGISPEWIPRLGQRFFRPDWSRSRQTGGSGLGLSIVKSTLQRHGGKLVISSELARFTKVSLELPKSLRGESG
ncbi:HAMP domain-containing protein [bacterium]|nr:HAMP domain-containing protein [bacterium]